MNFNKHISHEQVNTAALIIAAVALPFSVAICHAGIILFAINWLTEGKWASRLNSIKNNIYLWPFLFFFLLHLIGLIYSEDLNSGWFDLNKKTFFFLLPILLTTTTIAPLRINLILKSFVATCLVAVIICFSIAAIHTLYPEGRVPANFDFANSLEFKILNPDISPAWSFFSYNELSSGINIHPTYLGLHILFSLLLLIHYYKQGESSMTIRAKSLYLIAFVLFSAFVLLLSSRVITISYLIICLVGLYSLLITQGKSTIVLASSIFGIILVIASIIYNPISRYRSFQEFDQYSFHIESDQEYNTSSSIRMSLWWLAAQSITTNNWILGNGTGDVKRTMEATAARYRITNTIATYDPHNQFLHSFLALGITGLLCLIACLTSPLLFIQANSYWLYAGFIGIVVLTSLTESILESQKGIVFFSLFNSLFVFQLLPARSPQLKLSHG